jgi:hypothetical protein
LGHRFSFSGVRDVHFSPKQKELGSSGGRSRLPGRRRWAAQGAYPLSCDYPPCLGSRTRLRASRRIRFHPGLGSRREESDARARQLLRLGDADTALKGFESRVDTVTQIEGNKGLMFLADRSGGKTTCSMTRKRACRTLREQANTIREQAADAAGASIRGVEHYEVALDTRR